MKKIIALFLAAIMIFGMAACAAKPAASAEEAAPAKPATSAEEAAPAQEATPADRPYEGVTLKVGLAPMLSIDEDKAFWTEQLAPFEEETGAKVEITINDWGELETKYLTTFMNDSAYDLFYAWPSMLPNFIDNGFVEPMDNHYTPEEIADEYFWSNVTYVDGKTYGVAFVGGLAYRSFVFNMDILNECGVTELPTTWEELEAVCDTIHTARPDIYAFLFPLTGNTGCLDGGILMYHQQAGGSLINEEGTKMTLNTPEMKKAFEFMQDMMNKGYWSSDALGLAPENVQSLFGEGKVAITVTANPENKWGDADFEWAATTDMKDVQYGAFNATDILCMSSACENKEAATALLKYINSPDVRAAYNKIASSARLRASDYEIEVDPRMEDVVAHPERAFGTPMAKMPDYLTALINVQQQILSGELSIDDALAQLQAQMDAEMEG